MFVCEVEEGRKLAIQFYPQLSFVRHKPNFLDELTDAFRGLEVGVLVIEGLGEAEDLLAVELGEVWVESRGMGGGAASS